MPNCSILQCNARKTKNPGLTLHRMPRNKIMMNKWLEVVGVENLNPTIKDWRICSRHFEESNINRTLDVPRLKDGSVPSASLLPWSNLPSKQSSSNIRVSQKTALCEKENGTRSPSPMSDVSGDSSPEDSRPEEPCSNLPPKQSSNIGVSQKSNMCEKDNGKRSPSPIQSDMSGDSSPEDSLLEEPCSNLPPNQTSSCNMVSQKTTLCEKENGTRRSPSPIQSDTSGDTFSEHSLLEEIYRQNIKIKNLTKRCKLNNKKIRCLREQIRRRDRRITQLVYVVKKLKENICFNNEGTIILEEREIADGAGDGNEDMVDDRSSSGSDSTSNQHSLSRPSAGDSSQDATCGSTPSPPPAPSSPIQLPLSVSTTNTLTHGRDITPKETKTNDLMLVISPLTNNKSKKSLNSLNSPILLKETTTKDSTVTVPRTTNKKSLKPLDSTDVIKKTNFKPNIIRYTNKTKSKPDESTDNTDNTQTSKRLKLTIPRLNKTKTNLYDGTNLIKEPNSKKTKNDPITYKTKLKPDGSTDDFKEQTTKDLNPTISCLNNTKTLKLYDNTDLSKEASTDHTKKKKRKILKISPITNESKLEPDGSRDAKEQTTNDLTPTSPSISNINTLEQLVSSDLMKEVTSECVTLSKTTGPNKNSFIYIIEVD